VPMRRAETSPASVSVDTLRRRAYDRL